MGKLIKILLKLVFWGTAALAALGGAIVALQKLGVLPDDYAIGAGPVSLRVQSGKDAELDDGEIDDDLI